MKVLLFAAALRRGSYNRKLIHIASEILRSKFPEVEIDIADFREFETPLYDGDLEEDSGIPAGGQEMIRRIQAAHAIIVSTPEYNGGISGAFKNAIDWASRGDTIPFDGKPLLLLGTSPGGFGSIRGLWHTRVPLEAIGTLVYPEMFALPRAGNAFDEKDQFKEPASLKRLEDLLADFIPYAKKLQP